MLMNILGGGAEQGGGVMPGQQMQPGAVPQGVPGMPGGGGGEDQMSAFMRALMAGGGGPGKHAMAGMQAGQAPDMSGMYAQAPQQPMRQTPNAPRQLQSGGPMNAYLQAMMGGM
jgi:hypothetical protein